MNIGIIGAGRFGKLLQKHLSMDNDVVIVDKSDVGTTLGLSLQDRNLIIFAVPNRSLAEAITQWKSHINKTAAIMDVGSVKTIPCHILQDNFPDATALIGTHPLFGPDSAGESWQDRKMVFCKLRCQDSAYQQVQELFTKRGVIPIECTPQEHDQMMAKTQALIHFIGRALTGLQPQHIATPDYDNMLHMMQKVTNDTWELFFDMQNLNPYAAPVRQEFIAKIEELESQITLRSTENADQRSSRDAIDRVSTTVQNLRNHIDTIDEQIVALVGERFQLAKRIGIVKQQAGKAVQDPQREAQLYIKMHELSQRHGVPLEVVIHVYDYLMDQSRKVQ